MRAELLAPAGSFESLRAAVTAGADAVYVGGTRFGARAYADNLTEEELLAAIDYCHLRGCRLYLTVNTLLKDDEMDLLYDYLKPYYEKGLDAVIVQDPGVILYIQEAFPELEIHASTQMTICGTKGVRLLESLGVSRVVTSRELSLEEIREIRKETSLEIESFVHGALCYCYSGQCLYSSLIGGRSGNRGRCAQPCRLPYQAGKSEGYLLSPKDICTLEILPEILQAGVFSLKIEGRMKRPEYTAGVVRIYRKYLDEALEHGKKNYRVSEEDMRELMALYNRGGFTTGYYEMHNGRQMMSLKRANHFGTEAAKVVSVQKGILTLSALEELHKGDVLEKATITQDVKKGSTFRLKLTPAESRRISAGMIFHRTKDEVLISELDRDYLQKERKGKINGKLMISSGQPVILSVTMEKTAVSVKGVIPQPSCNQPLQPERVKRQIEKTGNTPFVFDRLKIEMEDGLFLPLQSINELRREAMERMEEKILSAGRRKSPGNNLIRPVKSERDWKGHRLYASVETVQQMEPLLKISQITGIYLDSTCLPVPLKRYQAEEWVDRCRREGKSCYYIMPYIFRKSVRELYEHQESLEALMLFDGIIFKNYEEFFFLREHKIQCDLIPDHNVYTYNRYAKEFWRMQGIERNTAPLELNNRELAKRGCADSEILVYGYLPMMVSAQCVRNNTSGCTKKSGLLYLKDRKGKKFPVKNHCEFCYNMIYNQVPLVLLDNKKELDELKPYGIRLSFTMEPPEQVKRIAEVFAERFFDERIAEFDFGDFTRGHFKRGVE